MDFKCNKCGKIETFHSLTIKEDGYYYKDKEICCCNEPMKKIEKKINWDEAKINIASFKNLSKEDKRKILKERSDRHFKKEIAESKRETIKQSLKNK